MPQRSNAARSAIQDEEIDGRRARGARTRIRVIDALLELVEEGHIRPTAQHVAERADVALRTVYHHFEDVEALRTMALELQVSRHREILQPIDPRLSLETRIVDLARQRRKLFELITPIRQALFDEHSSPEMTNGLRRARVERRDQLAETFRSELNRHRGSRQDFLDALDLATSWHTWNQLRSGLGRSAAVSERIMILTLTRMLSSLGGSRTQR